MNDFRIQRRSSFLSDRPISTWTRLFIPRIFPRIYYSSKYTSGRSRLLVLLIQIFMAILKEKKNAGKRKERAKSRWRRIAKRLDDQRSVLKSLLNLSLPSKTGHIYRQYRGGPRRRGARSWPSAKSNDRHRPFASLSRSETNRSRGSVKTGKFVFRYFPRNLVDDKDK